MAGIAKHPESTTQYAPALPGAVFFVGDSITFGWKDKHVGGWPTRLVAKLPSQHGVTAYNLGVRGDTSSSILARWQDEVGRRKQASNSVVVFAYGANDAKLHPDGQPFVHPDTTRRNTAQILNAALRDHVALVIGPAPVEEAVLERAINPSGEAAVPNNRQLSIVSGILADEASQAGVPYFDLMQWLANDDEWMDGLRETDGLHPPSRGHDLIAALLSVWEPWTSIFRNERTA